MDFVFDPSLVLYLPLWKLDGASIRSQDAHGHLCTATGALWSPQGRVLDGVDDYISVPANSALDITGSLSIILWVTATDWNDNAWRRMLEKGMDTLGNLQVNYAVIKTNLNVLAFASYDGAWHTTLDTSGATYADDTFYCLGIRFNSSVPEVSFYRNGGLLSTVAHAVGTLTASDRPLSIGAREDLSQDWGGKIGEVLIYNRALTPQEILHNYLATKWRYR